MKCPRCNKVKAAKNGRIWNGKQRYRCKDKKCGMQFVRNPTKKVIPEKTWREIDQVISNPKFNIMPRPRLLQLIVKYTGISRVWVYHHLKKKDKTS